MPTFRKKPVEVEAFKLGTDPMPDWFCDARSANQVVTYSVDNRDGDPFESNLSHATIYTLEGYHRVNLGDYVIKGVKGELYSRKPDIFDMTYELVEVQ